MARDDYFVIAYTILKYLYKCLKTGSTPDKSILNHEYFDVDEGYFGYILEHLYADGYVEGVRLVHSLGADRPQVRMLTSFAITPAGIEYLSVHPTLKKAKEVAATVAAFIPLIK